MVFHKHEDQLKTKYYRDNRDKLLQNGKIYYNNFKNKRSEYNRKYYQRHLHNNQSDLYDIQGANYFKKYFAAIKEKEINYQRQIKDHFSSTVLF